MRIFKDLGMVEQLGSGMPRILKVYPKECFKISSNFLRITLPIDKDLLNRILLPSFQEGFCHPAKENISPGITGYLILFVKPAFGFDALTGNIKISLKKNQHQQTDIYLNLSN